MTFYPDDVRTYMNKELRTKYYSRVRQQLLGWAFANWQYWDLRDYGLEMPYVSE